MKKNIFIAILLLFSINLFGQGNSGLGFNYQAVVRGLDGFVMPSKSIELRFSLLPGQQATQASWVETHNVTTDVYGTISVTVGKGTKAGGVAATFADVNFAAVYYWLKVEIKEGSNYRELSYTALASVPYAEAATNAAVMPAGTIVPYGGETIPDGWLLCDGREVSRSEYANLYNAIKTIWGHGNNSTTFNLPDMRGVFLRGVSGDSGKDADVNDRVPLKEGGNSGNNVGSYQQDELKSHTHVTENFSARGWPNGSGDRTAPNDYLLHPAQGTDYHLNVLATGGSETRPQNVNVNYIIKY